MQTRHNGTLTFKKGRRTLDGLLVEADAVLRNDAEIYTYTALSDGIIEGTGTLWAHVSSKPVGGVINVQQVVIYYPVDSGFVLPLVFGTLISTPRFNGTGGLT